MSAISGVSGGASSPQYVNQAAGSAARASTPPAPPTDPDHDGDTDKPGSVDVKG